MSEPNQTRDAVPQHAANPSKTGTVPPTNVAAFMREVEALNEETSVCDQVTGTANQVPDGLMPQVLPASIAEYTILSELGHGGMGAVYAAIDPRLDRQLALKVMLPGFAANPAAKERFLREARGTVVGTDVGLANFKGCRLLLALQLNNTRVTDMGLAIFKDCKDLISLNLNNTQVSDEGLAHFKDCKNLASLKITQTKVSAKGLKEFQAALPGCTIEHDGGVIVPKK